MCVVIARHRDCKPVKHPVGQSDWDVGGDGQRQSQPEVSGYLPGSGQAGQPDPGHRDLRAQLGGAGFGHVDVHPGHPGAGGAEQPGGEFLRHAVGHELTGGPLQEVR